jgi:nitrogen fixation/metabolism regulation signal transduction histidine kinase
MNTTPAPAAAEVVAVASSAQHKALRKRWLLVSAVIMAAALAVILMFLLTNVTQNIAQFDRYYSVLLIVNIALAGFMLCVVLLLAARLAKRLRQRRFGSRLLAKIALIFLLIGAVPGLLIYTVSYQFVSRSIESWFDVKVETALEAGLNLGRSSLDELLNELQLKTKTAATQLTDTGIGPIALNRLRDSMGVQELLVISSNGQVLGIAGSDKAFSFDLPSPSQLRQVPATKPLAQIEPVGDDASGSTSSLKLKALIQIPAALGNIDNSGKGHRYLQVVQMVPDGLARNALAVQEAYKEYQERAIGRKGLKQLYIGTLTLSLCLAVFAAVLAAVFFGNQLAKPLLVLAEGVQAVAQGDLSPRPEMPTQDELGGLTRDFNSMTRQLADARGLAESRRAEVETSRAYLQSLLDNMSAGVLVLDSDDSIRLFNPSAERMLQSPLHAGQNLKQVPGADALVPLCRNGFASLDETQSFWVQQGEIRLRAEDTAPLTLLMRGARLALPETLHLQEHIVVFDDISELISAQRSVAWGEVARRVAHEIKNPLTPIQLSAERLEHKLSAELSEPSRQLLARGVSIIVNQVDAMKRMVNDFRDYARLPPAELKPLDLNALIEEIVLLYGSSDNFARIELDLAPHLPSINGDATQLRQVIHNLLQNASDAALETARLSPADERFEPLVTLRTFEAHTTDGAAQVRMSFSDNGPGFAEQVLKRALEPYVTTKPKGTGLGLAIVKKIVDEHNARINWKNIESATGIAGAQVSITFRLA